jgi:hypothetical protein
MTFAFGSCACKTYQYSLLTPPVLVCGCCCRDCSVWTGSPYTVWVGVQQGAVSFGNGMPPERQTSEFSKRGHCPFCGTALTFRRTGAEAERDPLFYVTATSLADPGRVQPSEIVYYGERPPWFDLPMGIPHHEGASPEYGSPQRHGKFN